MLNYDKYISPILGGVRKNRRNKSSPKKRSLPPPWRLAVQRARDKLAKELRAQGELKSRTKLGFVPIGGKTRNGQRLHELARYYYGNMM